MARHERRAPYDKRQDVNVNLNEELPLHLTLELVSSLWRLCFPLLLTLHLAPIDELVAPDFLVDSSTEYVQIKELVLWSHVPEFHWGQMWIGTILDVLAEKIMMVKGAGIGNR